MSVKSSEPHNLTAYANETVPRLFSETEAFLDAYGTKVRSGNFLDSSEILEIDAILNEERFDAGALQMFLAENWERLATDDAERIAALERFSNEINLLTERIGGQFSEILQTTSFGSTFFPISFSFLEKYEETFGFQPMREETRRRIRHLVRQEIFQAKVVSRGFERMSIQAVRPISAWISLLVQRVLKKKKWDAFNPENVRIGWLALQKALTLQEFRMALNAVTLHFEREFSMVRRRLSHHGFAVSHEGFFKGR